MAAARSSENSRAARGSQRVAAPRLPRGGGTPTRTSAGRSGRRRRSRRPSDRKRANAIARRLDRGRWTSIALPSLAPGQAGGKAALCGKSDGHAAFQGGGDRRNRSSVKRRTADSPLLLGSIARARECAAEHNVRHRLRPGSSGPLNGCGRASRHSASSRDRGSHTSSRVDTGGLRGLEAARLRRESAQLAASLR
jgi:hypothetical protein